MRLEDQVYFGCAAYSMIHPNRASELNHLFLVIGNGYEWENGQLVECCGETTYKNGKRMSLNTAINNVFRRRRKNDEFRKRYTRNEKARNKRAWTHSDICPIKSNCNCGSDPHDNHCCTFFPGTAVCDCGAQARYDAAHPKGGELDAMIEKAIAVMKAAKEADPVGFEEKRKKQEAEWKASKRKWREEKKWEYRIPANIEQRIAYQEPRPGAHGGYNHWYPVCQYSAINDFPDTVKNDWLLGIIEVCNLVLANPPVVDRNTPQSSIDSTLEQVHKAWERAVLLAAKRRLKGYNMREVLKVIPPKISSQPIPTANLTKAGQRVQIVKEVPWSIEDGAVAARPSVGLKGKIANLKEVYPKPPEGKSAVVFKATDLGYSPSSDPDRKNLTLFVATDCLKAI